MVGGNRQQLYVLFGHVLVAQGIKQSPYLTHITVLHIRQQCCYQLSLRTLSKQQQNCKVLHCLAEDRCTWRVQVTDKERTTSVTSSMGKKTNQLNWFYMLNMLTEIDYWQLSSKIISLYTEYSNEYKIHLPAYFLMMLHRIIHYD